MDDDIEIDFEFCPKCGHYTYRQECTAIGCDEGFIDMYEYDDPLWYDPGDVQPCSKCQGKGYHHWCPNCGYDLATKKAIS